MFSLNCPIKLVTNLALKTEDNRLCSVFLLLFIRRTSCICFYGPNRSISRMFFIDFDYVTGDEEIKLWNLWFTIPYKYIVACCFYDGKILVISLSFQILCGVWGHRDDTKHKICRRWYYDPQYKIFSFINCVIFLWLIDFNDFIFYWTFSWGNILLSSVFFNGLVDTSRFGRWYE